MSVNTVWALNTLQHREKGTIILKQLAAIFATEAGNRTFPCSELDCEAVTRFSQVYINMFFLCFHHTFYVFITFGYVLSDSKDANLSPGTYVWCEDHVKNPGFVWASFQVALCFKVYKSN